MRAESKRPIGVVIPAYGHPGFLAEAITCACEQQTDSPVKVVVVDDGCRFPETGALTTSLQALYPGKLFYIRQKNTRLPGARNAGVRFLLEIEPDLDAVFFLDADNRIEPYALAQYRKALGDDPDVGWAYPDISFFGLSWGEDGFDTRETGPTYSTLKHLAGNISEAGSLVRADVFHKGLFFDETMRSGLEDWDFWLSLLEAGYHGTRAYGSGFVYRRRPESMLAASQREVTGLVDRMRKKHASLFTPGHILALEHAEVPAFAIHIAGEDTLRLTSDPLLDGKLISLDDFKAMAEARLREEQENFFPEYLIFLTPEEAKRWQKLSQHMRWLFWLLREKVKDVCMLDVLHHNKPGYSQHTLKKGDSAGTNANALIVHQSVFFSAVRRVDIDGEGGFDPLLRLEVTVPDYIGERDAQTPDNQGGSPLLSACHKLAALMQGRGKWQRHHSRQYSGPACVNIRTRLIDGLCAVEGHKPYPVCTGIPRDIFAFSVDFLTEKHTDEITALMQMSRAKGHEIVCFVEYNEADVARSVLPAQFKDMVKDIIWYQVPSGGAESRMYLGHRISCRLIPPQIETISTLLRRADNLYVVGGVACIEAAGELRTYGTNIMAVCSAGPGVQAQAAKFLAYEHVLGALLTDDSNVRALLASDGFPAGKIIPLETDAKV